ncbi:MAG: response regulator, partial [Cyanobacteria bacterium J06648_11]
LQALLQGWGADVTLYCLSESPSPHSMENDETPFDLAIVAVEPSLPPDHPLSPGLAIARRVSQRDVPLILLSANPHQTAARLSDIAPPLAVLSIPVRQSQLQSLLAQHFSLAESKTGLAAASIPASPPAETALLAEVMPLRVLLAEDVAVNQTVILALLNCLGYTADVVADGRTALEAIATLRYDLVSIDIHMPYMDGLDVMRQWRQRPEATPTKPWIIATTARALPGDRETCLAAGANDYLSKPIRLDALRDALLRFQRQTAPETATEPASAPPPTFPDKSFDPTALDLIRTSLGDAADATLAEIIDLYLDRSTVDLETITRAIATDDPGSLQDAGHSLKSASATVGAMAIAAHCERLETLGRLNTTEGASSILSQLQLDFPIAIAVLKSVRPETSDADDINA